MKRFSQFNSAESAIALGVALSLMHGRRRRPIPLTPEQEVARAASAERADWNKAVDDRKAAKRKIKEPT